MPQLLGQIRQPIGCWLQQGQAQRVGNDGSEERLAVQDDFLVCQP